MRLPQTKGTTIIIDYVKIVHSMTQLGSKEAKGEINGTN